MTPDPDCPKIRKDFQKFIVEPARTGKSMLHILHAADAATIPAVFHKYNAGIRWALRRAEPVVSERLGRNPFHDTSWFTLFLLVVRQRGDLNRASLYYREFDHFGRLLERVGNGEAVFGWDSAWVDALV